MTTKQDPRIELDDEDRMAKVLVACWACEGEQLLEKAGYHNEQPLGNLSTEEIAKVAADLYGVGLNVMLGHYGADTMIWVDTRKFSQR
jgi:hypothetical protein